MEAGAGENDHLRRHDPSCPDPTTGRRTGLPRTDVTWVRVSDLFDQGTARVAWRGINRTTKISRSTRQRASRTAEDLTADDCPPSGH